MGILRRLLLPALVVTLFAPLPAPAQPSREYDLKAVFLYNFASFVTWPEGAFADPQAPLVIGVLGEDPFGATLDEVVAGEKVRGRSFAVTRLERIEDARHCHIVFVSLSETARYSEIVQRLAGHPVLTVGDSPAFVTAGGKIAFGRRDGFVRLHMNEEAVRRSELGFSSKLLQLAQPESRGDDTR